MINLNTLLQFLAHHFSFLTALRIILSSLLKILRPRIEDLDIILRLHNFLLIFPNHSFLILNWILNFKNGIGKLFKICRCIFNLLFLIFNLSIRFIYFWVDLFSLLINLFTFNYQLIQFKLMFLKVLLTSLNCLLNIFLIAWKCQLLRIQNALILLNLSNVFWSFYITEINIGDDIF